MRLLVTGSSGFVGTNLIERLKDGYEIMGVDRVQPKERFEGVDYVSDVDLSSLHTVAGLSTKFDTPDVILHFAAQARVDPSFEDPIGTYRDNVLSTINLLHWARQNDIRFIVASSEIIYGHQLEYPCKETFTLRPDSPYAASKVAIDHMVQQCTGVRSVVIRSGMGYGPRSPPIQVITKFLLRCMDGKPLFFPPPPVVHPTRDVNYIGNFVRGIEQLLEHPNVTGVFNMGSGHEASLIDIAKVCIEVVGQGRIEEHTSFSYRPGEEGKRTWLDISNARDAFGYNPETELREGVFKTYEWLKNGRNLYGW